MEEKGYYWYFAPKDRRLRYGDGRLIEVGTTHTVKPPITLCERGLHASKRAIDALRYAPGPIVCRVKIGGGVIHGDDKSCATERTYLSVVDAEDTLRVFVRRCALDVIDLWDAPDVVREYLETGDESIRAAAWAAARYAARDDARSAAWAVAWAGAWDVVWSGARSAAWAVARDAARDAARAAKTEEYNGWLEEMLLKAETE